ncbi:MAG: UbiA family prenyltransferase [Desulfobacteraceae bacterium]|nr:UbiA family prenyltransferase [Desulfobacteraceae bacterium]
MALSRTPHGMLDMAAPALAALLWLGSVPTLSVIVLGSLTAFAGYTAVYALNDVVDFKTDRKKIEECGLKCSAGDIDAVYARHPMAQGLLSLRDGLLWTGAWGAIALGGAYLLNPACAVIFVLGCLAEAVYCLMLRLSWTRVLVSGAVKCMGGLAAIYAVVPEPSALFLGGFLMWFFFWEIGGQNVPNDWCDLEEDMRMHAETVPVRFGTDGAARIIAVSLLIAVAASLALFWLTPARLHAVYFAGALPAGVFLLLVPAWRLFERRTADAAAVLFNRASYYPLTMLVVILFSALV